MNTDARLLNAVSIGKQRYNATIASGKKQLYDWIDQKLFAHIAETESRGERYFDWHRDKFPSYELISKMDEAIDYIRQIEGLEGSELIYGGQQIRIRWPNIEG